MKIKNISYKAAIATLTGMMLSACGGGSSSGSSTGTTTPGTSTPTTPTEYTLKLPVTYANQCGERLAHPNAEVLIHDANWNVIARQSPNEEGLVELTVNEPVMAVSLITKSQRPPVNGEVQNERVDIRVYPEMEMADYSANTRTYAHYETEQTDPQCECATGTITVNFPSSEFEVIENNFTEINFSSESGAVVEGQVEVCKYAGAWPVKRIVAIDNAISPGRYVSGMAINFDELQSSGFQAIHIEHERVDIALASDLGGFDDVLLANTINDSFYYFDFNFAGEIKAYPTEATAFGALTYINGTEVDYVDGGRLIKAKRVFSTDANDVTTLVNDIENPVVSESQLTQLFTSNSFDFSASSDYSFLGLDVTYNSPATNVNFYYTGGLTGSLPDVDVYTGYEQYFNGIESADIAFTFFDYSNLADTTAKGLTSASLNSFLVISAENYETHYRRYYEWVSLELDRIYLD